MKFLVDLSVEADALMFKRLISKLKERGHEVILTARSIVEANKLQEYIGLKPHVFGEYSGTLEGKLIASSQRIYEMAKLVQKTNGKLDGVVSNTGIEACRLGFGLNTQVHTFHDHPNKEAMAQMKLTIPISTYVYAPWVIPKNNYTQFGLEDWQIVSYKGFLSTAWMPYETLDSKIVIDLKLDEDRPIIVFRHSEMKAAYLFGKHDITIEAVKMLAQQRPDIQFVTRPRYSIEELQLQFPTEYYPNVIILPEPVDMRSLLAKSIAHIGGGATMCLESAYLGIPTITSRPIMSPITDWLETQGLAHKAYTSDDIIYIFNNYISGKNSTDYQYKAKKVFGELEFPLDRLIENMERGNEK
jgi:predicted glycosyltransferase